MLFCWIACLQKSRCYGLVFTQNFKTKLRILLQKGKALNNDLIAIVMFLTITFICILFLPVSNSCIMERYMLYFD